jgi:hypothetical protein
MTQMFCSNCGRPDQTVDTYCRGCGEFLADSSNPLSLLSRLLGARTPVKQITVNLVINLITAAISGLLLVFLNGYFDGRQARTLEPAPPIVYLVYIFLALVAGWQLLSFAINLNLRNRLGQRSETAAQRLGSSETSSSPQALPEADFEGLVPPSVIEDKTERLHKRQSKKMI